MHTHSQILSNVFWEEKWREKNVVYMSEQKGMFHAPHTHTSSSLEKRRREKRQRKNGLPNGCEVLQEEKKEACRFCSIKCIAPLVVPFNIISTHG